MTKTKIKAKEAEGLIELRLLHQKLTEFTQAYSKRNRQVASTFMALRNMANSCIAKLEAAHAQFEIDRLASRKSRSESDRIF